MLSTVLFRVAIVALALSTLPIGCVAPQPATVLALPLSHVPNTIPDFYATTRNRSTRQRDYVSTRRLCSPAFTPSAGFQTLCVASASSTRKLFIDSCSSRTILLFLLWRLLSSTDAVGKWSCSSNGSNNTSTSRRFSGPARTPSRLISGLRSPCMCGSPFWKSTSGSLTAPTQFYRYWVSRFSRKRPFYRLLLNIHCKLKTRHY